VSSFCGLAIANHPSTNTIRVTTTLDGNGYSMDSNITNQQDLSGDLLLSEPHFDEEATLLSARPVVPLEEIQTERRFARRLGFGIAIISALILGALGAKFINRSGSGEQSSIVVSGGARAGMGSVEEPIPAPSIVEGAAGAMAEALPNTPESDVKLGSTTEVNKTKEAARQKPAPRSQDKSERRQRKRFDVQLPDEKTERERRHEGRGQRNKSGDGVLRIREIFEGPSRP